MIVKATRRKPRASFRRRFLVIKRWCRARPGSAQAHYHLGLSLARSGRVEEAVASLREAVRLAPQWPEAQNDLGYLLAECGQHREAESCYREALRLRPDYAAAHNNLGLCLVNSGRVTEGVAHYEKALRHQPDFAQRTTTWAMPLPRRGNQRRRFRITNKRYD